MLTLVQTYYLDIATFKALSTNEHILLLAYRDYGKIKVEIEEIYEALDSRYKDITPLFVSDKVVSINIDGTNNFGSNKVYAVAIFSTNRRTFSVTYIIIIGLQGFETYANIFSSANTVNTYIRNERLYEQRVGLAKVGDQVVSETNEAASVDDALKISSAGYVGLFDEDGYNTIAKQKKNKAIACRVISSSKAISRPGFQAAAVGRNQKQINGKIIIQPPFDDECEKQKKKRTDKERKRRA